MLSQDNIYHTRYYLTKIRSHNEADYQFETKPQVNINSCRIYKKSIYAQLRLRIATSLRPIYANKISRVGKHTRCSAAQCSSLQNQINQMIMHTVSVQNIPLPLFTLSMVFFFFCVLVLFLFFCLVFLARSARRMVVFIIASSWFSYTPF